MSERTLGKMCESQRKKRMHLKKRERRKKTSLAVAALSGDGAALLRAFFYRNICRGTTAGTLLVFVFFCLVTAASVSDLKCRKIFPIGFVG